MAAKKASSKKSIHTTPKGWEDWNPTKSFLHKAKETSKGAISEKNLKTAEKIGKTTKKAVIELAVGDPKKGARSMAINAAAWAIPYGKGAEAINMLIKGEKYVKTAKVVRGALKTAGVLAGDAVVSKAAGSGVKKVRRPRSGK